MPNKPTHEQLAADNRDLRARLEHSEATLSEILSGEADALFVTGATGAQLFTLKGADQSYRTLIEHMNEGALTISREGLILYANQSFAEMLKTPLEKVIASSFHSWLAPDSHKIMKAMLDNDATHNRRAQLDLAAGGETRVPVSLSVSNLLINGMPEAYCLVATDLTEQIHNQKILASEKLSRELLAAATQSQRALLSVIEERKQAEESLRQLNEELESKVVLRTADLKHALQFAEQANSAKSDFLAAMSHEIRTPMNGVIGMLDVLQQSSLSSQQLQMVDIIHDSAFALLAVIEDILDFSKIEAGKLQIDSVPMDIASMVEGVCDSLDYMAITKAVELTMFSDPTLPAQVLGDPGRLRQILVNLTNNAIKFSSKQGRQARVSVRATRVLESAAEWQSRFPAPRFALPNPPPMGEGANKSLRDANQILVEFSISDNGIGIDATTQARLFTPFTQADISTTRTFGGTGLGLVICLRLVKIIGGEISVQSEPDKGAVFTVRLPFNLVEENVQSDAPPSVVSGLHCLVAGGANSIAADMAAYLVQAGALIEQATDLNAVRQWIAVRQAGLYVVVIDTGSDELPLADLHAAASAGTGVDVRFVIIGRGKRRQCRLETAHHVVLDAEVMHRKAFLEAVAIAAGRVKMQDLSILPGGVGKIPVPLSREETRRRGRLILIAEDNDINQRVIQQQITLLGHVADIADNGRKALELWQSGDYGLLLTDLHMPELDGYELTRTIRAAENISNKKGESATGKTRIPVIAFTANALKGEAEHCQEAGMDDYLSKPVQLVSLKEMLKKWLPDTAPVTPLAAASSTDDQAVASSVPVDVNVLKALVGDDAAIITDFLHDYRLSAATIAVELRTARVAGDTAAIVAAAHKLKSSSRSMGALALGELCAGIEKSGKAGDSVAIAAQLLLFEQELKNVEDYLEPY